MRRGLVTLGLAASMLAPATALAGAPLMLGSGTRPQANLVGDLLGPASASSTAAAVATAPEPTPAADCGPGSREAPGIQGRVVGGAESAAGYWCNATALGHAGRSGGYKVERYVDRSGHECAYYDTTLLFPRNAFGPSLDGEPTGTAVLDLSDSAHPVRTATLMTPAMQSTHESLLVNHRRGLLAAVMGTPVTAPGFIDIYNLESDCRHPVLESSTPVGLLGHESGWTRDGQTFYATNLVRGTITAVDVADPKLPRIVWVGQYPSHGLTLSDDGRRAYVAARGVGLIILDTSEVQDRKPDPQVREISRLTWPEMTIPQVALPVTIHRRPYLVEVDEFSFANSDALADNPPVYGRHASANGEIVGAARIIDISAERAPKVVSNLRLAVNQPENRAAIAGDPGASSSLQGYAAHYCGVPRERDPGIVACSFIASGLRVFDIRDPLHPREAAYFVAPPGNSASIGSSSSPKSDWAMSRPAFDRAAREVWYSDGNSGFYTLRLSPGAWPSGG